MKGCLDWIEGPALEGPPLSESDRDWAQSRMERDLDRAGISRHPFQIPDRKPPLADMFFDSTGRLWVVKTLAAGESVRNADVWDGTTLVAHYRWPSRILDLPTPWATESALYGGDGRHASVSSARHGCGSRGGSPAPSVRSLPETPQSRSFWGLSNPDSTHPERDK